MLTTLGDCGMDVLLRQLFLHALLIFVQDALTRYDEIDLEHLTDRADFIMSGPRCTAPPVCNVSSPQDFLLLDHLATAATPLEDLPDINRIFRYDTWALPLTPQSACAVTTGVLAQQLASAANHVQGDRKMALRPPGGHGGVHPARLTPPSFCNRPSTQLTPSLCSQWHHYQHFRHLHPDPTVRYSPFHHSTPVGRCPLSPLRGGLSPTSPAPSGRHEQTTRPPHAYILHPLHWNEAAFFPSLHGEWLLPLSSYSF